MNNIQIKSGEKRQIGEERRWHGRLRRKDGLSAESKRSPLRDSLLMRVDHGEHKERGSSLQRGMLEGTELLFKSSLID